MPALPETFACKMRVALTESEQARQPISLSPKEGVMCYLGYKHSYLLNVGLCGVARERDVLDFPLGDLAYGRRELRSDD